MFQIIDRFSEDVDVLAVFDGHTSENARHKVLKQVHNDVVRHLALSPDTSAVGNSTRGVQRYTAYRYPTTPTNSDLRDGVVLELGSRGGDYPVSEHSYSSMVADYAIMELGESADTWDEFEPFTVSVLAPERTLLEKLAGVHDAAARTDTSALSKHGRHFYDIERLLSTPAAGHSIRSTPHTRRLLPGTWRRKRASTGRRFRSSVSRPPSRRTATFSDIGTVMIAAQFRFDRTIDWGSSTGSPAPSRT